MTSVLFGVLTANSLEPSLDSASGRTWPLSNATNDGAANAVGVTIAVNNKAASRRPARATSPSPLLMIFSVARPIHLFSHRHR